MVQKIIHINNFPEVMSGYHGGDYEERCLVGCDAVQSDGIYNVSENALSPSSVQMKMEAAGYSKLVPTRRHIPPDRTLPAASPICPVIVV